MSNSMRKGMTYSLDTTLARLLSSVGHCCVIRARLVLGPGFIVAGLAQHQPWSLL